MLRRRAVSMSGLLAASAFAAGSVNASRPSLTSSPSAPVLVEARAQSIPVISENL
jgi:hypothetical protein